MKHLLYVAALSLGVVLVFAPAALAQDVDCPQLSYEEAQAILASDPSDPNRLDADNDGEACEQNASSPQPAPQPQPSSQSQEKEESSEEWSEESSKESYTKESTTKQEQRKELPATGGSSFLLPTAALLLGSGLLVSVVLRRR